MTEAEKKLWQKLRKKQLYGYRFRKQHPIGQYIADFVCMEARVIIELDGGQHADRKTYDAKRTAFLQGQGFSVLRFWNNEVMENMEGVLMAIFSALSTPSPTLPLEGEGEAKARL